MPEEVDPPKGHKELFGELIDTLGEHELPWYEGQVVKNIRWWFTLAILSIALSLLSSFLAASSRDAPIEGLLRTALIMLPVLSTGIAGFTQLFRFREKEALREDGRIELSNMVSLGRSILLQDLTEEKFRQAYLSMLERFHRLEQSQHRSYVEIHSERPPDRTNGPPVPRKRGV